MLGIQCLQIRLDSLSMTLLQVCYFISYQLVSSRMSFGHQGEMTSTFAPTTKEGLTFSFYCLICLYDGLNLP